MTTTNEYRELIGEQDRDGLIQMWDALLNSEELEGWSGGKALEFLILRAIELEQGDVVWPYSVRDDGREIEQIDGAIYLDSICFLLEAKDYSVRVDVEPIAKLRSQILRRPPGTMGIVFSKLGFTAPATVLTKYTSPQSILLWSGDEFDFELRHGKVREALKIKYRMAQERGLPDFDARVEFEQ